MRARLLSVTVLGAAAALVVASVALATLSLKDRKAVHVGLANAQVLLTALTGAATHDAAQIGVQRNECRTRYHPSGRPESQRVRELLSLEAVRLLQHDGLADYEAFVAKEQKLSFADGRLRTAQRALTAELSQTRKLTGVPTHVCADLAALANAGYSQDALRAWAKGIDAKAGVSEADAARADAAIKASRPALRSAALSAVEASLLIDAQTGDIFVGAFTMSPKPA